jgi:hypothetical protein
VFVLFSYRLARFLPLYPLFTLSKVINCILNERGDDQQTILSEMSTDELFTMFEKFFFKGDTKGVPQVYLRAGNLSLLNNHKTRSMR